MLKLIAIAFAPVVVILAYVYHRDRYNKEPLWMLLLTFVGGVATVPAIIFWEEGMIDIMPKFLTFKQSALYNAFAVAALCEESLKLLVFVIFVLRSSHFNEKFDGIVYAVYISMGFALVENLMYVFNNGENVGMLRALTAVPAHALFAISMGFHFGRAKFSSRKKLSNYFLAWAVPILLHGTYNYILMSQPKYLLLTFILYLFVLYRLGFKRMKTSSKSSVFRGLRRK